MNKDYHLILFWGIQNRREKVNEHLTNGNYSKAANLYEQAITANPKNKSYYWQLGLMLLLQGLEEEAQTTWLLGMADGEVEQVDFWTVELIQILAKEANRRVALKDFSGKVL